MGLTRTVTAILAAALSTAPGTAAQPLEQAPGLPGEFKPVVGAGAQYEVSSKEQGKSYWTYVVVGKETVQGAEGYWLEMRLEDDDEGVVMKQLMLMRAGRSEIRRLIVQPAGEPPTEMPLGMIRLEQRAVGEEAGLGERVGTETITVPAGSFVCDHYRTKSDETTTDVWLSTKISPYGLVKMVSPELSVVLMKVLAHEKSRIQGEPQKSAFPIPDADEE